MHGLVRRRFARVLALACVCSLIAVAGLAASAAAKPGNGRRSPAEQGWPESHQPAADPRPGQSGHLKPEPASPPPQGMTDEEFKAADPAGYAAVVAHRGAVERQLLAQVHGTLNAAGVTPASQEPLDSGDMAAAATALASTAYSPYGYLRFTLTPNTSSPYARNGYLGTLYFIYGIYSPAVDSYSWYTVSWPGRSGNNIPASQSVVGVGPIPAYTYDFGYMYGAWRGYEPDGRTAFYPGKWRLDPWTGAPYGRSCLEVHGGTGTHTFGATSGCIRIYPGAITSLRSYYTYKMANKYDRASAHLYVQY